MDSERPQRGSEKPSEEEGQRRRAERVLPELIKKFLEAGIGKIVEGPENLRHLLRDLKVPKDIASFLVSQVDETKNDVYRIVAKQLGDFLEHTNVAEELSGALSMLTLQIKTEIRFVPNDKGKKGDAKFVKPDIHASVNVRSDADD